MLEIAIGLVFVYLLLSLLCTAVNEWVSQIFAMRAKNLKSGIRNLLNDEQLYQRVYRHPLIRAFHKNSRIDNLLKRDSGPSYISANTFAMALLDVAIGEKPTEELTDVQTLIKTVEGNPLLNTDTKKALKIFIKDAAGDLDRFKHNIENWYDNTMERVSGWYKRQTKLVVLGVAAAVCIALNADTLTMANRISQNQEFRNALVQAAGRYLNDQDPGTIASASSLQELQSQIQQLDLPLGWVAASEQYEDVRELPADLRGWFYKLAGLLITIFAVSLGAPFWFDLVNRVANLRSSGNVPAKPARSESGA